ncbi:unnamed protein product [Sphagnum jensenii]|uniref:Cwf19-like C-terminal domain-containing protein n=1 Tax=Sphagnum jensenii TaxID=128206 RepID=A0ABP1B9K2_9BRYO
MTSVASHGGSLLLIVMKLLEMTRNRYALQNCFNTQGNPTVLFEWYLQQHTGTHAHLQVVPIPLQNASSV